MNVPIATYELLLSNLEVSAKTLQYIHEYNQPEIIVLDPELHLQFEPLQQLAKESLDIFNEIIQYLGGIPVALSVGKTLEHGHVTGVNRFEEGLWIFSYKNAETGIHSKIKGTSNSLLDIYQATLTN